MSVAHRSAASRQAREPLTPKPPRMKIHRFRRLHRLSYLRNGSASLPTSLCNLWIIFTGVIHVPSDTTMDENRTQIYLIDLICLI